MLIKGSGMNYMVLSSQLDLLQNQNKRGYPVPPKWQLLTPRVRLQKNRLTTRLSDIASKDTELSTEFQINDTFILISHTHTHTHTHTHQVSYGTYLY